MLLYCFVFYRGNYYCYISSSHRHLSTKTPIIADCCLEFFLTSYCLARFFFFFSWHFSMIFDIWEKYTFRWLECCCLVSALVNHKTDKKALERERKLKGSDTWSIFCAVYWKIGGMLSRKCFCFAFFFFLVGCCSFLLLLFVFLLFFVFDQGIHAHIFESLQNLTLTTLHMSDKVNLGNLPLCFSFYTCQHQ